jgi:tRNA (guanine10-N2)-dimethyltransferase
VHKLLLILSGEHQTLPAAEVKAVLEAEECKFKICEVDPPIMIVEVDDAKIHTLLKERLAMTLEGIELLFKCQANLDDIERSIKDVDFDFLEGKTMAVRVSKKAPCVNISSLDLERKLGAKILERTKKTKVNLRDPDVVLRGVLRGSFYYFGIKLFEVNRGAYDLRRPRYRPFFHPGSLEPRICRVFVNLARPRRGSVFLDPFNGTGGFSIEASIIGCQVIGLDIDDEMCHGALKNLKSLRYDITGVIRGDARKSPFVEGTVDSIATDPPYGRSTSLKKALLEDLINSFLRQSESLLKKGGYLCFAHPAWLTEIKIPSSMTLVEQHDMRVHKSLTRRVTVLRKL